MFDPNIGDDILLSDDDDRALMESLSRDDVMELGDLEWIEAVEPARIVQKF